jgi:hypothetical protein
MKCPECKKELVYDEGEQETRLSPGQEPCLYCTDCGLEFPIDHEENKARLILEIDITYIPNGVSIEKLKNMLYRIPHYASERALFTEATPAEIDEWVANVKEKK